MQLNVVTEKKAYVTIGSFEHTLEDNNPVECAKNAKSVLDFSVKKCLDIICFDEIQLIKTMRSNYLNEMMIQLVMTLCPN